MEAPNIPTWVGVIGLGVPTMVAGWAVIEGLIWLFRHIHFGWVNP